MARKIKREDNVFIFTIPPKLNEKAANAGESDLSLFSAHPLFIIINGL
jgi:hypothetical protein